MLNEDILNRSDSTNAEMNIKKSESLLQELEKQQLLLNRLCGVTEETNAYAQQIEEYNFRIKALNPQQKEGEIERAFCLVTDDKEIMAIIHNPDKYIEDLEYTNEMIKKHEKIIEKNKKLLQTLADTKKLSKELGINEFATPCNEKRSYNDRYYYTLVFKDSLKNNLTQKIQHVYLPFGLLSVLEKVTPDITLKHTILYSSYYGYLMLNALKKAKTFVALVREIDYHGRKFTQNNGKTIAVVNRTPFAVEFFDNTTMILPFVAHVQEMGIKNFVHSLYRKNQKTTSAQKSVNNNRTPNSRVTNVLAWTIEGVCKIEEAIIALPSCTITGAYNKVQEAASAISSSTITGIHKTKEATLRGIHKAQSATAALSSSVVAGIYTVKSMIPPKIQDHIYNKISNKQFWIFECIDALREIYPILLIKEYGNEIIREYDQSCRRLKIEGELHYHNIYINRDQQLLDSIVKKEIHGFNTILQKNAKKEWRDTKYYAENNQKRVKYAAHSKDNINLIMKTFKNTYPISLLREHVYEIQINEDKHNNIDLTLSLVEDHKKNIKKIALTHLGGTATNIAIGENYTNTWLLIRNFIANQTYDKTLSTVMYTSGTYDSLTTTMYTISTMAQYFIRKHYKDNTTIDNSLKIVTTIASMVNSSINIRNYKANLKERVYEKYL